jgi:hypothetical protein
VPPPPHTHSFPHTCIRWDSDRAPAPLPFVPGGTASRLAVGATEVRLSSEDASEAGSSLVAPLPGAPTVSSAATSVTSVTTPGGTPGAAAARARSLSPGSFGCILPLSAGASTFHGVYLDYSRHTADDWLVDGTLAAAAVDTTSKDTTFRCILIIAARIVSAPVCFVMFVCRTVSLVVPAAAGGFATGDLPQCKVSTTMSAAQLHDAVQARLGLPAGSKVRVTAPYTHCMTV